MNNRTLHLVRGLPGSGKTTLAHKLSDQVFSADDYFYEKGKGVYHFAAEELPAAHAECRWKTEAAMIAGHMNVAVANTFSQAWEAADYFEMAKDHGYLVNVVECQSQFGNVHGVPESSIDRMRERWEPLNQLTISRAVQNKQKQNSNSRERSTQ